METSVVDACKKKRDEKIAEREGGKLVDYTALSSNDYVSNWLCRPCFLLLQSCVAAESHFYRCKANFLRSRNIDSVESGDVVHVKHCRPLMQSPSSQSAKVPKVSRSPPMQKNSETNGKPHYKDIGEVLCPTTKAMLGKS